MNNEQQQFAQPAQQQQQQFAQQQQQFAQQQQQFGQHGQQFGQHGQQFFNNQFQPTMVNQEKLKSAWTIGLIGIGIVLIGFIIGTFSFFSAMNSNSISSYAFKNSGAESATFLTTFFQFMIVATFIFLTLMLKNSKSKALAIVLIVFSSIFIFTSILGIATPIFGVQLSALLSTGGWATVLTSGILATAAFK